jgi:hypothetical protein
MYLFVFIYVNFITCVFAFFSFMLHVLKSHKHFDYRTIQNVDSTFKQNNQKILEELIISYEYIV